MKGIILAGGTGSRLRPITHVLNKNLLPVYNKPAIFYSIEMLRDSGIYNICIVAEYKYVEDFKTIIGNGIDFGVDVEFISDSPLKKGPASAVNHARNFVKGDSCVVVFADGIYDLNISNEVSNFKEGALIFVKAVDDPHRFGIVEISDNGEVLSIEEKPMNPKSNYAQTGLAIYDNRLFNLLHKQKPSPDGEYYLTDINIEYLNAGNLKANVIDCFWQDVGTFDGLLRASNYFHSKFISANINS